MNRTTSHAACLSVALVTALGAAGCAESAPALTASPSATREPQADFRSAKCNLGEVWDRGALVVRASYTEPTLPLDGLEDHYGPTIANDSCSDAEILTWQELRRTLGEDDTICRVVWYDDYVSAITYDIGCAVPLVVSVRDVR